MDVQALARNQAFGRLGIGLTMLAAPGRVNGPWVGPDAEAPGTAVLSRALAAREIGLGLGLLAALRAGRGARPWILAGVLADVVDLAATVRSKDDVPSFGLIGVGALASGSALIGAYLQGAVD